MKKVLVPALIMAFVFGCSPKQNQESLPDETAVRVTTVMVKKEKVVTVLQYSGTVEANRTIPLSFKTTGTVERVLVQIGDKVRKGQLLATLDPTDSKSMYQIAWAKYQQAKDAYDRLHSVYEKGSLSEIKWVEMETNLEQAKSSLEMSKNNLDKSNLYSPVSGVVSQRNIEPGMSSISIGPAPLEIADIKEVYVKIAIPENEVVYVKKGMNAHFTVSALNGAAFMGEVTNISPVADPFSRTYDAKIKVINAAEQLKPGMVCDLKMEQTSAGKLILIPYQSVSQDNNYRSFVFVVDSTHQRVKKQIITIAQYHGKNLEVVSGLKEGQLIVEEGKEKLSDNSLITL